MTFPSELIVEHFVGREDIERLRNRFVHAAWLALLEDTCKEPPVDLLEGGTY